MDLLNWQDKIKPRDEKKQNRIHTELHDFVNETRTLFGETAEKGFGSFSYYLGRLKNKDLQTLYEIRASVLQDKTIKSMSKVFFYRLTHRPS